MWLLKLMERLTMWSTRRMLKKHFRNLTKDNLMEMAGAIQTKERDSEEWAAAFMASRVFTEIRCQCGVTYIAGETLSPALHEYYAEARRQGGSVEVLDGMDKIHTSKISGKLHVYRCPCTMATMRKQEQFVRANREAILEYLAVTDELGVDPPKSVNRMKRETNETD